MKAMVIVKEEGGGTLAWRDVPDPTPGRGEEAASLPVAVMTEHDAIVTNGRLGRGESVLITGRFTRVMTDPTAGTVGRLRDCGSVV